MYVLIRFLVLTQSFCHYNMATVVCWHASSLADPFTNLCLFFFLFFQLIRPKFIRKKTHKNQMMVWFMVFNATFNNISVISWRSVLLVKETSTRKKSPTCHKSQNQMKINSLCTKNKQEHQFLHLGLMFGNLELQYPNLFFCAKGSLFKIQNDRSTRTKIITWKSMCLQTHNRIHV